MYLYIGTCFGVPVYLHRNIPLTIFGSSLFVSVTAGFFLINFNHWSVVDLIWMASIYILGMFAGTIVHESAHAIVAHGCGERVDHIAIAFMSGWCQSKDFTSSFKQELVILCAGSLSEVAMSFLLLVVCILTAQPGVLLPIPFATGCLVPMLAMIVIESLNPYHKGTDGFWIYTILQEQGWSRSKVIATFVLCLESYLFGLIMLAYVGYRFVHAG